MSHVIIDTDAGLDDFLAIAFLVTQRTVEIDAITIVNGLAHVPAGAHNVLRLLQLAGRTDIPVYLGAEEPLPGGTDFLAPWRKTADTLHGVALPSTGMTPKPDAIGYLAQRFASPGAPFTLLALGPHTNLARALQRVSGRATAITQMIMMGGAVYVPGNVDMNGNTTAEWNMYEDPAAASQVFRASLPLSMVPLDATNEVPIGKPFLAAAARLTSPLGVAVSQLLNLGYTSNDENYFAWDPLSAVSLVVPAVVSGSQTGIDLVTAPPNAGWTRPDSHGAAVTVNTTGNAALFQSTFLGAFS
jgi:pyrimidine-specific ribonucleoside hydrolase